MGLIHSDLFRLIISIVMNDWKDRLGVVFSTNPDFNYTTDVDDELDTMPANLQKLRVMVERKGQGGKTVTIIKGFKGKIEDLKKLEKMLKTKSGVGGSSKDGDIILQGDIKDKVIYILKGLGYSDTK